MKKHATSTTKRKMPALLLFLLLSVLSGTSQSDTVHLNYNGVLTTMADSTDAKINQWIKKLGTQHTDIEVLAYYSKPEYKKFSIERADNLFLILNRKARSLFSITFIGPKKGENSQRSRVDIVYRPTGRVDAPVVKEKPMKAKKEEEPKKESEKATATEQKTEDAKPAATEKKKEKKPKSQDGKIPEPVIDTTAKTTPAPEEVKKEKPVKKKKPKTQEGKIPEPEGSVTDTTATKTPQ